MKNFFPLWFFPLTIYLNFVFFQKLSRSSEWCGDDEEKKLPKPPVNHTAKLTHIHATTKQDDYSIPLPLQRRWESFSDK